MYCPWCGIKNPDDEKTCRICQKILHVHRPVPQGAVHIDLTRYPYLQLMRALAKNLGPLMSLLFLPILSILYWLKKPFKSPLYATVLNSTALKLEETRIDSVKGLRRAPFEKTEKELLEYGFEHLADYECISLSQGISRRVYRNPQQRVFAAVYINNARGRISYVSFFGFFPDSTYLSVDNVSAAVPLALEPKITAIHRPGASVSEIHEEFSDELKGRPVSPVLLDQRQLLLAEAQIHRITILKGIEQGHFFLKGKNIPTVSTCYHHPTSAAVRNCSRCSTPLCESCYTVQNGNAFCDRCLPSEEENIYITATKGSPLGDVEGMGYAGLGIRTAALLGDLFLLGLMAALFYFGLRAGINLLTDNPAGIGSITSIVSIASQFAAALLLIIYFTAPVYRYGGTPTQKILGLKVVDDQGHTPDLVSTTVRFAYHIFTGLFLFPVIGYLVIPFRRARQGFHDQLAQTFVITRRPKIKALLAWPLIIGFIGLSILYVIIPKFSPYLSAFLPFFSSGYEPEVTLEARWTREFGKQNLYAGQIVGDDRYIITTEKGLTAIDMRSGTTLWINEELSNGFIQSVAETEDPLFLFQQTEIERARISLVDPKTGRTLWQKSLSTGYGFFDNESIFYSGEKEISRLSPEGEVLWTYSYATDVNKMYTENLIPNGDVLLVERVPTEAEEGAEYDSLQYLCLNRRTGDLLWERKGEEETFTYPLGKGYQIMYDAENLPSLVILPERKILYTFSPEDGYINGHIGDPTSESGVIYTASAARRATDGSLLFKYPAEASLGCLTQELLVLISGNGMLHFLNQRSGETGAIYDIGDPLANVSVIHEDETGIVLGVQKSPASESGGYTRTVSLLFMEKGTHAMQQIPIGKNLPVHQIRIFSREGQVFIPTRGRIGSYLLPSNP